LEGKIQKHFFHLHRDRIRFGWMLQYYLNLENVKANYDPAHYNNPEDVTHNSWLFRNTKVLISETADLLLMLRRLCGSVQRRKLHNSMSLIDIKIY
jgi:hypothetical protein